MRLCVRTTAGFVPATCGLSTGYGVHAGRPGGSLAVRVGRGVGGGHLAAGGHIRTEAEATAGDED